MPAAYLNSSLVFTPGADRLAGGALLHAGPHIHHVVVAPAGQVSPIRGPLQPTHFLRVTGEREDVVVRHPNVVMVNVSRS